MERGLARNTTLAYASDLRQFFASLEQRGQDPIRVSRGDLEDYLWELKSRHGLEASSLFRKIEALRSFYFFQAAERRLDANPAAELRSPRRPLRLPECLSAEEMRRLLAAPSGSSYEALRARVMIELLYATGMRVSEILALKAEYVNLQDGWVRVLGKGAHLFVGVQIVSAPWAILGQRISKLLELVILGERGRDEPLDPICGLH